MVFGQEALVAFFTNEVPFPVVGVEVLLQVIGFEELLVALRAGNLAVAAENTNPHRGFKVMFMKRMHKVKKIMLIILQSRSYCSLLASERKNFDINAGQATPIRTK